MIALAPWLYPELDVSPLDGRRFAIVHGALDRGLPGMPGRRSRAVAARLERARARGVDAVRTVVAGALHPIALRAAVGRPRADAAARAAWAELVGRELEHFCA